MEKSDRGKMLFDAESVALINCEDTGRKEIIFVTPSGMNITFKSKVSKSDVLNDEQTELCFDYIMCEQSRTRMDGFIDYIYISDTSSFQAKSTYIEQECMIPF
jgi:hypothetical protein